jgi:hypothetical protein
VVGSFTADQHVATTTAEQLIVAIAADLETTAIASVQPIVTRVAIEPGGIGNGPGNLNVVVAGAARDDDPPLGFVTTVETPLNVTFSVDDDEPGSTTIVSLATVPVINKAVPPRHVSGIVWMLPGTAAVT